jgi:hypothetical protein
VKPCYKTFTYIRNHFLTNLVFFISLVAFLLLPTFCLMAQSPLVTYRNEQEKFSISYPASFTRYMRKEPGVVFFARNTEYGLPSVTVTKHGGIYQSRKLSQHVETVLQSYRNVGLTDARYEGTNDGRFALMPKNRNGIVLSYSRSGQKLFAEVTFVSTANQHFIVTYVDTPQGFTSRAIDRNKTIASFSLDPIHMSSNYRPYNSYGRQPNSYGYNQGAVQASFGNQANQGRSFASSSGGSMGSALLLVSAVILGAATIFRPNNSK